MKTTTQHAQDRRKQEQARVKRGMKPKRLEIIGRRWFQKSYGNTYHSFQILIDDVQVAYVKGVYGYGDHYRETAFQWLEANGYLPEQPRNEHTNARVGFYREHAEKYGYAPTVFRVFDVERKRDL